MELDKKIKSKIDIEFTKKESGYLISKEKLEKISLLNITDEDYEYVNNMVNGMKELFKTTDTSDIEPLFSISDMYENVGNINLDEKITNDDVNLKNNSLYFNEELNTLDVPIVVK